MYINLYSYSIYIMYTISPLVSTCRDDLLDPDAAQNFLKPC